MNFSTISASDKKYNSVLQLRNEVLRVPLGLSLFDENLKDEKDEIFFILEIESKIVACCQLKKIDSTTSKLRQMAVLENCQHKGYGKLLIDFLEHYAKENGILKIELHARKNALDFYKKLNYQIVSNEFLEVGTPHIKMEKVFITE